MHFNLEPHLTNELIELVPLHADDFEKLYAVASDPLIWEQHPDNLRYQRDVFKNFFDAAVASKSAFLIYDKPNTLLIGCSRYYDHDAEKKSIAIGYTFLARSHWGNTYNKALKQLMIDYALNFVETINFHIGPTNFRSRKAVEKLGARLTEEIETKVTYSLPKKIWQRRSLRFIRTDNANVDFNNLVHALDILVAQRDGDEHAFYAPFNKIDNIRHVVVAYFNSEAVGCGAIKKYDAQTMEIKRMFVTETARGLGVASKILIELENWARELGFSRCILETGIRYPEAIALYKKSGYGLMKNYGQYEFIENSVCFEKMINLTNA